MEHVNGLHHITAIAGNAQENLDFYSDVLGMRLVKKSVNQDDPGTYHLFYADAEGSPGSDLTFFPWEQLAPPRHGHGMALEVGLEVPHGSLDFWEARFRRYGARFSEREHRFERVVLPVVDPHGLRLALVEETAPRRFAPWEGGPVPPERQIRGLHGARVGESDAAATSA
ncbi:MAG: ring-cleaving dioxygenase, partial [Acidobacteria bacterium]